MREGIMKVKVLVAIALAAILSLAYNSGANAQAFSVTVSIDENGNGQLTNSAGFSGAMQFALQADPGPGGLASALTYSLLNPPGLVAGDLILLDPSLLVSDIIRFNPDESIAGAVGAIVFYSILGEGSLADTGFLRRYTPMT